ncbi:unnamed protein product [Rotaria sp. Silwood1]|nr:unnamed protein product [Rotaria sp. Silwood1]CAF4858158.1 unnamed protein product [Rotaria sp. Silwood1]
MSSTGHCFDIGMATRHSVCEFEYRQKKFAQVHGIPFKQLDHLSDSSLIEKFDVFCSDDGVAGNGALMRLAPLPLFFYKHPKHAVEYSGISGQITHGDKKAYDCCRYYGALIVAAMHGTSKQDLLDNEFYVKHKNWFNGKSLVPDVMKIAKGSYKRKGGYNDGIRGKGYIVNALEAALWAFWSDENSFEKGALAAVNLGDDTDTTAAIYGQLAGAYYGYDNLSPKWLDFVYAKDYLTSLSKWLAFEAEKWNPNEADQWNLTKLSTLNKDPTISDSESKPDDNLPELEPDQSTSPEEKQASISSLPQESAVILPTPENEMSNLEESKIETTSTKDEDTKTKMISFTSEPSHTAENDSPQPKESTGLSSTVNEPLVCLSKNSVTTIEMEGDITKRTATIPVEVGRTTESSSSQSKESTVSSLAPEPPPIGLEDVRIQINPTQVESMETEPVSSTSTPGHTNENRESSLPFIKKACDVTVNLVSAVPSTSVMSNVCSQTTLLPEISNTTPGPTA